MADVRVVMSTPQWELAEAALEHADAAREEADETAEELVAARADAEAARGAARAKAEQLQVRDGERVRGCARSPACLHKGENLEMMSSSGCVIASEHVARFGLQMSCQGPEGVSTSCGPVYAPAAS